MGTMNAGSVIIKLSSFPAHIHSVPLGGLTKLTDIRQMIDLIAAKLCWNTNLTKTAEILSLKNTQETQTSQVTFPCLLLVIVLS